MIDTSPAQSYDEDARRTELAGLVSLYYDKLVRFLRRRGHSTDDATEMVQETFERLARPGQAPVAQFGPFLFKIALNISRDHAKSAASRYIAEGSQLEIDRIACSSPVQDRVLSGAEQMIILEAALKELDPRCRAILIMYRFHDLPQKAIAKDLGVSLSTVEKDIHRGLLHCRRRLAEANGEKWHDNAR